MDWQIATVLENYFIAHDIKCIKLLVPSWSGHFPGQHCSLRLTSKEGHIAERRYSIANVYENEPIIELGVEVLKGGALSPYLHKMEPGDQIEIKGPLGAHFVWKESARPMPIVMIVGGSGIVPGICMTRAALKVPDLPVTIIGSFKSIAHIPYQGELEKYVRNYKNFSLHVSLTREVNPKWEGRRGRIDSGYLYKLLSMYLDKGVQIFICGSSIFVEEVSHACQAIGFSDQEIRIERFG